MEDTGYFVDADKRIVGPSGPTAYHLDDEGTIFEAGRKTGDYFEDGHLYRVSRWLRLFTLFSPTGHRLDPNGRILGDRATLPW